MRILSLYLVSHLLWLVLGALGVVFGQDIHFIIVCLNCTTPWVGKLTDGLNEVVWFLTNVSDSLTGRADRSQNTGELKGLEYISVKLSGP